MTLALREPAIHPEGTSPLTATNGATLAAYLPFHILLPQNTRPGRRTDVRS